MHNVAKPVLFLIFFLLLPGADRPEGAKDQAELPLWGEHAQQAGRRLVSPTQSLPPIVFVSRNPLSPKSRRDPGAVPGLGPQYRTAIVGGMLMLRGPNGDLRALVDHTLLFDVADPCVSWNGREILFSGVEHPDSSWRIYRINADGTGFVQLTHSDRTVDLSQFGSAPLPFERYDDFDPCYLPDGSIVFASTRYPSMASYDRVLTSNLFGMDPDGKRLHRITTERNGGEEPTIDPVTGRIVYSRWWVNIDRPDNQPVTGLARDHDRALTTDVGNVWHAATIKPDGDGLKMYAGFPRSRTGSHTYKPAVLNDGTLLSVFTANTSLTPVVGGTGIRWFRKGADFEHHVIGLRSDESDKPSPPYATDPVQLSGNTILISYSRDGNEFGLYSCGLDGSKLTRIIDRPGVLELDAQVVHARTVPPVLRREFEAAVSDVPPTEDPATYYKDDTFRFDCMNVFTNGGVDEPMPDAPRIAVNARIRFFLNVQRRNLRIPDPSIHLKDAEVFANGSIHEHDLPAEVPLFEQVVDASGKVLSTPDGRFAHVSGFNFERQGAGTKCVGCHAGHSMLPVPVNGAQAEWFNAATSAQVTASSGFDDDPLFAPRKVVDRQARTGGDTVNWVANEAAGAYVHLSWEIPLEIRRIVLYNIQRNSREGTTVTVNDSEILLYNKLREVGRKRVKEKLSPSGTPVDITPVDIDAIRVIVRSAAGRFRHRPVAGLAEIETIARISPTNYYLKVEEQE